MKYYFLQALFVRPSVPGGPGWVQSVRPGRNVLLWFCYVVVMFAMSLLCFAVFSLCFAMVCYVLLCFCYVLLCFAMCLLCFAMLLLCFAMLCYVFAMFCYVLLTPWTDLKKNFLKTVFWHFQPLPAVSGPPKLAIYRVGHGESESAVETGQILRLEAKI